MAISEVQLPQLPTTEFERTGSLGRAREGMERHRLMSGVLTADSFVPTSSPVWLLGAVLSVPFLMLEPKTFREYRTWTLEQLALAVEFLLGREEPMLAGETAMFRSGGKATRDLGVAATGEHLIVFRFESLEGQPRWIAMAARHESVTLAAYKTRLSTERTLVVTRGAEHWVIRGHPRVFDPWPVMSVWRNRFTSRTPGGGPRPGG